MGTTNVPLIGLYKNHITLVKFASPEDADYAIVSSTLILMSRDASTINASTRNRTRTPSPTTRTQIVNDPLPFAVPFAEIPETSAGRYRVQSVQTTVISTRRNERSRSGEEDIDTVSYDINKLVKTFTHLGR